MRREQTGGVLRSCAELVRYDCGHTEILTCILRYGRLVALAVCVANARFVSLFTFLPQLSFGNCSSSLSRMRSTARSQHRVPCRVSTRYNLYFALWTLLWSYDPLLQLRYTLALTQVALTTSPRYQSEESRPFYQGNTYGFNVRLLFRFQFRTEKQHIILISCKVPVVLQIPTTM